MDANAVAQSINTAFSDWRMSQELLQEIHTEAIDPEEQELRDYLCTISSWQEVDDDWFLYYPIPIMSWASFQYLLPYLLRRNLLDDDFDIKPVIEKIAQYPKRNMLPVLRIDLSVYSAAQIQAIQSALQCLYEQTDEEIGRMHHHLRELIPLISNDQVS
ncbi:hypothetical protein [Gimesia maris]|uniref:hypothetical protein n=1 Tax=Gimesia maris TaxID=122 RepID=UPI0032ECEC90